MSAHGHHTRVLMLLTIALALGSLAVSLSARPPASSQPFAVAELFFELNDTDRDLGIHASIDGGTWTSLEVEARMTVSCSAS